MKPEVAQRRIAAFRDRFGEAHYYFACHAAFPLALTPDLLYRLWANFQRDIHNKSLEVPWMAVADVLLSGLCDEVGQELYEMPLSVRRTLLSELKTNMRFTVSRIHELSNFLLMYVQQHLNISDPDERDIAQAQKWIALAYVQPTEVARDIAFNLSNLRIEEKPELLRLTSLAEMALDEMPEFEPLLVYSSTLRSLACGKVEDAAYLNFMQMQSYRAHLQVSDIVLTIPKTFRIIWFNQSLQKLTRRQREVLSVIVMGKTDSEIRKLLEINQESVREHVLNICKRLNIGSTFPNDYRSKRSNLISLEVLGNNLTLK